MSKDPKSEVHREIEAMIQADYRAELLDLQRRPRVGVWSWMVATNTVHWSPELFHLFGMDPSLPAPRYGEHRKIFTPESWARLDAACEDALKKDIEFSLDLEGIRVDGERIWLAVQGACQRESGGSPLRLYGITQDITPHKRIEARLQKTQEHLRVALTAAGAVAFEVDVVNGLVERYFSSEPALPATEGKPEPLERVRARVHPDDREKFESALSMALASSDSYRNIYRVLRPDGTVRWIDSWGSIFRDESGRAIRMSGIGFDVTDRQRAAEQLSLSDERFRLVARATNDVVWDWDLKTNALWWNENFQTTFGYSPVDVEPDIVSWVSRIHPDDRRRTEAGIHQAIDGGGAMWSAEYRFRRCGGEYAEVFDRGYVIRDKEGKPIRMIGAMMDVTEIRRADRERFETSQRLQALMDALPVGVTFSSDASCTSVTGNPVALAQFAATDADNLSASATDASAAGRRFRFYMNGMPISDRELPLQRAIAEGRVISPMELEVKLPNGRSWVAEASGAPVRDASGKPIASVAVTIDITQRKRIEEQLRESESRFRQLAENNRRLLEEVNHRVKNNLASILGLLSLSASRSTDVRSFADSLRDRILAMSRVHELLSAHQWQDVTVDSLVEALLNPMKRTGILRGVLTASGPEISIAPRTATALALVLQELAVNSHKYGANTTPQGRVAITWSLGRDAWRLEWIESNGPAVVEPTRRGLGLEIIDGLIVHDLSGRVDVAFPATGFTCRIHLPVASPLDDGGAGHTR